MEEGRAIAATLVGVAALLILILRFRMNAFAALLAVAIGTALGAGMAPMDAVASVQSGMAGTLGFIAPIVGLGALFGALLEAGGGIAALGALLKDPSKTFRTQVALGFIGLIAATPVFFDVGLLILLPLIIGLARSSGRAALVFGLPLLAGLATGHAFVPPTPGPMAIAELISADIAQVARFGAILGGLCVVLAGPLFTQALDRVGALPEGRIKTPEAPSAARSIAPGLAILLITLPLLLILSAATWPGETPPVVSLIGHPFTALLLACLTAAIVLRPKDEDGRAAQEKLLSQALLPAGIVILVTGAGGSFKQVLVDSGAGAAMGAGILTLGLSPVLASFLIALTVRVAQGSATVAMVTAAGLAAPIIAAASPNEAQLGVLTIAIAAGATGFSHVNDSGFWLVRELFGLTTGETLRTWTLLTGLIALTGLLASLALYPMV